MLIEYFQNIFHTVSGKKLSYLWVIALLISAFLALQVTGSQAAPPAQKPDNPPSNDQQKITTNEWAVQLRPDTDPNAVANRFGFENLGQIGTLTNFYLFRQPLTKAKGDPDRLRSAPEVVWLEQQVARQQHKRVIPTDPLYADQWHLDNTGQSGGTAGEDVNIVPVWNSNIMGTGVVIGIVDDGLQYTHPDLSPNYVSSASYDFNGGDSDPSPNIGSDFHGTAAAGVAAARDNTTCGVGSAFRAGVSGLRLIAGPSTDADEASALTYMYGTNDIFSNSWGPFDDGARLEGPGALTQAALQDGVTNGRGGLGNIYTWAAGNGLQSFDNVNYDGYANSRFTIAVGAVDHDGVQSFYSEPGAAMLVTAPSNGNVSGITTTDLLGANGYSTGDCTSTFGGTSSATPLVSGIIALMLEANPNLSWRDVQHILVETSEQNDSGDGDWTTNGAGYLINHKYGFGRIDAQAAVNAASSWTNVAPATGADSGVISVNQPIPDTNPTPVPVVSNFVVSEDIALEHVEVIFNATHTYRGDLEIILTSPAGTESILAEEHGDSSNNYNDWQFMTVRNWGESSQGTWSLKVTDKYPFADEGTFNSWQLVLHGTGDSPIISGLPDQVVSTNSNADNAIDLWAYANDSQDNDSALTFTISNSPVISAGVTIDSNRYIDINPTSGWLGTTEVTVQVEDTDGFTDTDTFQVDVIGIAYLPLLIKVGSDGPVGGIINGDFESGPTGWTEFSINGFDLILSPDSLPDPLPVPAHSGIWGVWLGGADNEYSSIEQDVTIPSGSPYLAYWHWINSGDDCNFDFAGVDINSSNVDIYTLCTSTNTGDWVKRVVDLSAFTGQSVTLTIWASTDFLFSSSVLIDDVTFQSTSTIIAGGDSKPPLIFAEEDMVWFRSGVSPSQDNAGEDKKRKLKLSDD